MPQQDIEGYELSPQQKHLVSLQDDRDDRHYRVQMLTRIEGELDKEVLGAAWSQVVERHELLRTVYRRLPEMHHPLQVITRDVPELCEHDLAALAPAAREVEVERLCEIARAAEFDFEKGALLDITLASLSAREHVLLLTTPALCADRRGIENLVAEIARAYHALRRGDSSVDQPMQYVDVATWQNELLEAKELEQGRRFWQDGHFESALEARLASEWTRSPASPFDPRRLELRLAPETVHRLDELGRRSAVPEGAVLMTAWQALLQRLTGESCMLVSWAGKGRELEELQGALGLLERSLPLQGEVHDDMPFEQLLSRVAVAVTEAERWQEYFSWEYLRSPEGGALFFPFAFEFVRRAKPLAVGNLSFFADVRYACVDRFKIKLYCEVDDHGLTARLNYDAGLYAGEDIERLGEELETLLSSAAEDPAAAIADLRIIGAREREQVVVGFNAPPSGGSSDTCLHQLFESQVERTPDQIAVVCETDSVTFAELNARANRLAHYLQTLGAGADIPIALHTDRGVDMMVGLLGILKSGAAYVPLDPVLPQHRLKLMMSETRAPVVITQSHLEHALPEHPARVVRIDADWPAIAQHGADNPQTRTVAENLIYVLFTSGSTGQPKGVAVEHRQLVNYVEGIVERLTLPEGASFASVTSLATDLGNTAIFSSLCTGGCLHLVLHDRAFDARALADYFSRHRIDLLKIVPSHLRALLASSFGREVLPRRWLVLGGESCSWDLVKQVQSGSGKCAIFNHYGPTETTVGVTTHMIGEKVVAGTKSPPIGRPIPNASIYLLDHRGEPVPVWASGELYIGGWAVARGYLNQPELTAERFLPDPFSDDANARLYRTGDLARYLSDGSIEFLGRADDQVKLGGFRVEPAEVESALSQHPGVAELAVTVREDSSGEKRLVAYLVFGTSKPADAELRAFLAERLPDYMLPSSFVRLGALPRLPSGKVDRGALPAPSVGSAADEGKEPSMTPMEELISEIWKEVLELDHVGVHDNFYDLGGHSLLAMQVVSTIEKQTGVWLSPREMIFQTLRQIAAVCESRLSPGSELEAGN